MTFQSLGRDSVHSSDATNGNRGQCPRVSIPRSGFCSFKLPKSICIESWKWLFQSLGRDSVHSSLKREIMFDSRCSFQSLGRDSVHSSPRPRLHPLHPRGVSIPRSGFCSFKQNQAEESLVEGVGFNPSVGILFIQAHSHSWSCCCSEYRFNPSVGILFIQARDFGAGEHSRFGFNPSVGILFIQAYPERFHHALIPPVSIPRSGFCSFKPRRGADGLGFGAVFQSLGRDSVHSSRAAPAPGQSKPARFQSLGRDSVHSSLDLVHCQFHSIWFQSLGRDSVHSSLFICR